MAAVLLVSFFLDKHGRTGKAFWIWNLFAWLVGFIVYQVTVHLDDLFLGPTLISVIVSAAISYIWVLKNRLKPA